MGFGGFEKYVAFNTLIQYDQNLEFQAELAESWEIPDNITYIFYLRKGVRFHDGTEFNAEAVKWNFERMLSDYSQVRTLFDVIDTIELIDDYTVKIKLKHPYAPFLDLVASNALMVSPAAVEKMGNEGFQKHPVGTGPFVFETLDRQKGELVFVKNENYWRESRPYLDKIIIREIPDDQTRLFALQTGDIDYDNNVLTSNMDELRKTGNIKFVSILGKSNTIDFLTFNCQEEPFNNKKVRQAVSYALDQETIAQFIGHTELIYGPLPDTSWGSNPDKPVRKYDPEKARKLMIEAGYENGFSVKLKTWSNDPKRDDLALIVKEMLAEININVEIEVLETGTLFQQLMQNDFAFASMHWGGGGSLDPNGNLQLLFDSRSMYNWISNYRNIEVDTLLQQALEITDRSERQKLYWKAEELIIEDQPMIWFGRFVDYIAYSSKVHGVEPLKPAGYFPFPDEIWIEN
jgi:peptide/nickel transport system substrate-binding protein